MSGESVGDLGSPLRWPMLALGRLPVRWLRGPATHHAQKGKTRQRSCQRVLEHLGND